MFDKFNKATCANSHWRAQVNLGVKNMGFPGERVEYSFKSIFKYLALLLVVIAIWKVTKGFGSVIATVLVISALMRRKPIEMMFWVMVFTFCTCGNRNFFVANAVSVTVARGTLVMLSGVLAFKLFGGGREARLMTPFWGIMIYIFWEFIVSVQGYSPIVSYLKLVLFVLVFLAMYGVANGVNRSTRANARTLRSMLLAIFCMIILGSVALIPFPGISYMSEQEALEAMLAGDITSLFQGMTSQPQVLGPLAGILATFLFADLAFSIKKWDKFYLLLLILCPFLLYKTSSRTGMGVLVAGLGMVTFLIMKARGIGSKWKGKMLMVVNGVVILMAIAVVVVPSVRGKAVKYILKGGAADQEIRMEDVVSSRQQAIDVAKAGFKKRPLLGNGFQVSWEMEGQKRKGFVSYLSAPIEKGVWIYAIPEEGGIIGMAIFCIWLVVLFKSLIERHAYIGASVFFAFLVSNLGEFSIFSTGYIGGFYWTLTFAAVCLDVQRMKSSEMQIFFVPIEEVFEEVGEEEWMREQG